jgi:hypothetical protein
MFAERQESKPGWFKEGINLLSTVPMKIDGYNGKACEIGHRGE